MRYFVQQTAGVWMEVDCWCFEYRANIVGGPDVCFTLEGGRLNIDAQNDHGEATVYVIVIVPEHNMRFAAAVARRMLLAPWIADQIIGWLDNALRAAA